MGKHRPASFCLFSSFQKQIIKIKTASFCGIWTRIIWREGEDADHLTTTITTAQHLLLIICSKERFSAVVSWCVWSVKFSKSQHSNSTFLPSSPSTLPFLPSCRSRLLFFCSFDFVFFEETAFSWKLRRRRRRRRHSNKSIDVSASRKRVG